MKVRVHTVNVWRDGAGAIPTTVDNVLYVIPSHHWLVLSLLGGSTRGFSAAAVRYYEMSPPVEVDHPAYPPGYP